MKRNILFISRIGGVNGWGNYFRLRYVANLLNKKQFNIFFFIETSNKDFKEFDKGFNTFLFNYSVNDFKKSLSIIKSISPEIISCEVYKLPLYKQLIYKRLTSRLIIFDDIYSTRNYNCDVFIACQKFKKPKNFGFINAKEIYEGYKYFPISKDLIKVRNNIKKKNKNILLSLGGGNYLNLYLRIIRILKEKKKLFNNLIVCCKGDLELKSSNTDTFIKIRTNQKNVYKEMNNSNLSIVSGGYHKIEANYLGNNCIAIATNDHQICLLKQFKKYSNVVYLSYNDKFFNSKLSELIDKILLTNKLFAQNKFISEKNNEFYTKKLYI